jgi:hypothetical protein
MTAEQIRNKHCNDCSLLEAQEYNNVVVAMEEYAKQQSISFTAFRDNYRREQLKKGREEQKRLGGLFTWDYTPDEQVYELFIAQQSEECKK